LVEAFLEEVTVEPTVQVEVELVEGRTVDDYDDIETDGGEASDVTTNGGGGVGVILSRINNRRRNSRQNAGKSTNPKFYTDSTSLINAWSQFATGSGPTSQQLQVCGRQYLEDY
jgi:hypothetical protein